MAHMKEDHKVRTSLYCVTATKLLSGMMVKASRKASALPCIVVCLSTKSTTNMFLPRRFFYSLTTLFLQNHFFLLLFSLSILPKR
ncbi:hypothetical protein BDV11DRAFT_183058 [Aspergillus similis]